MSNEKNNVLLEVKDLVVQYVTSDETVEAVNGVSFTLNKGEALGLVGETGAGKTTIAKSIMRILPDPPAKVVGGEIYFDGEDLFAMTEQQMRDVRGNKISMIFQDPMSALNPVFTVGEQIGEVIGLHDKKLSKHEINEATKKMLEMVGIPGSRASEYPHQFSGGMKQRIVIAIALACNPELLLADEPTTALDVTIQAQVLDMMHKLKDDLGTALILITHDLGIVAENCDKVAVTYAGEIVEYGNLEDLYDHHMHPYTEGLFGSLPDIEGDDERLHPIDGMPPDPTQLPVGCNFADRCPYATDECTKAAIPAFEVSPGHLVRCVKAKVAAEGGK